MSITIRLVTIDEYDSICLNFDIYLTKSSKIIINS